MDKQQVEQIIENSMLSLELKLKEEVAMAKKYSIESVQKLETKIRWLQQVATTLFALAVIFGLSGAWGYKLFSDAQSKLTELQANVSNVSVQVERWNSVSEAITAEIVQEKKKSISEIRNEVKVLEEIAVKQIRERIGSHPHLSVRSLSIVDGAGNARVQLKTSPTGGHIAVNSKAGKKVVSLGMSDTGNGGVWFHNRKGQLGLAARATEKSGKFSIYNAETRKAAVNALTKSNGDGYIRFYDVNGSRLD